MDLSVEGLEENAAFRNVRAYLEKHPDMEKRARAHLHENPGASRSDMCLAGFSGLVGHLPFNLLKQYFGVDSKNFNAKNGRLSDSELDKRYALFRDFVRQNEGRFRNYGLPKGLGSMIERKYDGVIYRAVFDVCRAGKERYEPSDFLPFANYMAKLFLMKRALFAQEQDLSALESAAYEGLLKASKSMDFSRSLQEASSYLFSHCMRDIESEDNLIGGLKKSSVLLGGARGILKGHIRRTEYERDKIIAEFAAHNFPQRKLRSLRYFFDKPLIVSLDDLEDAQLAENEHVFYGGEFKEIAGDNESLRAAEKLEFVDFVLSEIPSITKRKKSKRALENRDKNVFLMYVFGGKTFIEIAERYGFTHQRAEQIYSQVCDSLERKMAKLIL